MATAELPRPGVEVVQEFQSAAPTIVRPTLVPFVCGPAKEVIEATTSDGTTNANARQGTYAQLPLVISQSAFPSPRGNIAEVNVEEGSIQAFLSFGGQFYKLPRDPGSAFLTNWNHAGRAAIQTLPGPVGDFDIDGDTLVIAVDVPSRLDTTKDFTITFAGATVGANLTPAQVAAQINSAVGVDVATVTNDSRVQITSPSTGAKSSITVRAGGTANAALGFNVANEYRLTGSGFRGQDQSNNTTITPWVEWTRGQYLVNGTVTTFPAITGTTPGFGLVDTDNKFTASQAANLTFTGGGSIDLRVGDIFYADGSEPVASAVIKKVEATRFRLGTVNTKLSIFDEDGNIVTAVYDDANVGTIFSPIGLSPAFAWFKANNVNFSALPTAAKVTGTVDGTAATTAVVEGTSSPSGPFSLTGLTLVVGVTIDGEAQDDQTFTFSGPPLADMAAVATAIGTNVGGVLAVNDAGRLKLSTTRTGKTQELVLRATSTAGETLGFDFTGGDVTDAGTDIEFNAIGPTVTSGANPDFANMGTKTLVLKLSTDAGATFPTTRTHTFAAGPFANIAAIVADITGDGAFMTGLTVSAVGTALQIRWTAQTGDQAVLKMDASSTGINGAGLLQFTPDQTGAGTDALTGLVFDLRLNDRPKIYSTILTSSSLVDAVEAINATVGWPVASIGGTSGMDIIISSDLKGFGSKVEVIESTESHQANISLGFAGGASSTGTGRPNPDFYLDPSGNAVLGPDILRSPVTGQPYDPGTADLYIQYTGLRVDLSPAAGKPALISVSDVTTLTTVLGPLNQENPLGLGMFFELINAPGILCTGMGVDDAPAAAPEGTLASYARVAGFIESQEIYAIAPLTHDEGVAQMFKAHVELMEQPEQKGERILFVNPSVPTRALDNLIASGLNGTSTMVQNQFVLDVNPQANLIAAGINPALAIPVSAGLYLQVTVGGNIRRYNVSGVNGVVMTLKTTFAAGENTDGFFTNTPLTETLVNENYSLEVRGDPLVIPGSTIPDKNAVAATVAAKSAAYKYRRMFYTFPDKVRAVIDGTDSLLEGYYACAAVTGMVAHFPPQQGFTNMPMVGFSGAQSAIGKFSTKQQNAMAGGGTYIFVQDVDGAPLISRHQVSTDTTTVEKRELSVTKIVDFTAKFLRTGLRNFIGTFNITQPFLDTVSTVIHGMLKFLEENGVLISGDLNNIIQSKEEPDTVLVDILLDVPFPCNYIRLTLVI